MPTNPPLPSGTPAPDVSETVGALRKLAVTLSLEAESEEENARGAHREACGSIGDRAAQYAASSRTSAKLARLLRANEAAVLDAIALLAARSPDSVVLVLTPGEAGYISRNLPRKALDPGDYDMVILAKLRAAQQEVSP